MSQHVFRRTASGLALAEDRTSEESAGRDLRAMDDRLFLVRDFDTRFQRTLWRVFYYVSDWQDAAFVLDWRDDLTQEPLPLSSGIIEAVQRQRPENRGVRLDADAHNAKLTADRQRAGDAQIDEVAHDFRKLVNHKPDPHHIQGPMSPPKRFGAGA